MAIIDQLYHSLSSRFETGQKSISCADFSGESATAFDLIFDGKALQFSEDSTLGALANQKFKVSGKLNLWNLGALDFDFNIEENGGKLDFVLSPQSPLTNWHFAKSFPDLQNSYLDYLDLTSVYLIASSFNHDYYKPVISLKTGLNFYGIAGVSEAIASLQELYPKLSSITLKGTISCTATPRLLNLQAALPDPDANTTDAVLFMVYDSNKSEQENSVGEIREKLHRGKFILNQSLELPFDVSPLIQIYNVLKDKLREDQVLRFQNTDLGGTLATKFSTVLGIDHLTFSETKLTKSDREVELTGKTTLFGLPESTTFHFRIVSNANSLEMVVYPKAIPKDWKFSQSFPQTRDSFFDDLDVRTPLLIASSYSFQHENPAVMLAQGINLAFQSSNTRSLERLQELGTAYSSINFQGVALPVGSQYNLKLLTSPSPDLDLKLLGLQAIKFRSPVLNLQSGVESGGEIAHAVLLKGICSTPQLTYPASIQIPTDGYPYLQLLPDEPTRGFENILGVLTLSDSQNIGDLFPTKFTQLNNIAVQGPEIYFATWGDNKTLVSSTMTLVDKEGEPRYWEVLESPNISIGNLRVGITYGYFGLDANHRDFIFRGSIGGTIVIGSTSAIDIDLLVPLSGDWILSVTGATFPSLADVASFLKKPQTHLTAPLPTKLYKTEQAATLSQIQIGFNPLKPSLSFLSFALNQNGSWEILPNFSIENWTVFLKTDATQDYAVSGHLHGFIKIGSVVNIEADLPIPPGDQGWTLGLKEGTSISFPSIGEILELAGKDASSLPSSFTTFGAFDIADLAVNFSPNPAAINWFRFAMQGRQKWVLIAPNKLVIDNVVASLRLSKKSGGGFDSVGEIAGVITIFDNPIWVGVKREAPNQPWKLGVIIKQAIHLPGLSELASWMMKKDMANYLPDTFMPFGQGFDLIDFNVLFDLTQNTLQSADFSLVNSAKWNAIPDVLAFDNVLIQANIANFNQDNQALTVHLECVLSLGSAELKFTADRQSAPNNNDPWAFSLALQKAVTFNELIKESNLGADLQVPATDWLPVLTIQSLEGKMVPANGIYKATGSASINWQIPLLHLQLPIVGIGGMIDVCQKPGDDANNYKKGAIFGTLDFASLKAVLSLQLGTAGVDTIFTATLSAEQAQNIQLAQLGNQFIATASLTEDNKHKETVNWEKLAPSDLDQSKIRFEKAYIYFNQTQEQFFLYGAITNFGSAILLAQQAGTATEQGYLFAFALAEQFKFSHLFSGLAFIDDVLLIRQASLVVNSYPVDDAATLKTQLDQITTNPLAPAKIQSPLAQSKFPTDKVARGVHLFAALDLSTPLFSKITALHKDKDAPAISLYAFFSEGKDSSNTVFSAELANFTLFDTLSFKGASQAVNGIEPKAGPFFQYIPKSGGKDTSAQFTFIGQIGVSAFDKTLAFDGAMVVNQESARLTLQPPTSGGQSVLPFPDVLTEVINLRNLGLDFTYTFAKTKPEPVPALLEMDLYGSVSILETIDFTGHLHLMSSDGSAPKPVLVEVALTSDLSISRVVNRLVSKTGTSFTWPSNFFDLAFLKEERNPETQALIRKSTLYYYKTSDDKKIRERFSGYTPGYNLESTVALTFLEKTIQFSLTVHIEPGQGIKAQLGLIDPIDLYILQLAGPIQSNTLGPYEDGPTLVLDTTKASPEFGFSTGINFLQKPFGVATVLFGKDKKDDLKISGTFSPPEDFSPFHFRSSGRALGFSYSKNEGFIVSNWPNFISAFEDVLKIMKQLETITDKVGNSDFCKEVADFVTDVAFNTKFSFTNPQFITQDKQLHFVLTGTYTVVLASEVEVCTVTLPKALNVPIPNDLSLDKLPLKITETLGSVAVDFVKALVDNPDALAKFIGIVAAKNASKIGARMLCRGIIDATVNAAIDATAAIVLDAAAKAGVGVAVILGGKGALDIVGKAIDALVHSNENRGGPGSSNSNGHASSGGNEDPKPAAPVLRSFSYASGQLIADWDGVMYAEAYQLWITRPNGTDLFKQDIKSSTRKDIPFKETTPGAYTARLASVRGKYISEWSGARTLNKLDIPASVKLEPNFVTGKLTLSWTQVSGASSYFVQVFRDGNVYQKDPNRTDLQYVLDIPSLPDGTYNAVVNANSVGNNIFSESAHSNPFVKSSVPSNIVVKLDKERNEIVASWDNVLGNEGYRFHLLDGGGNPISETKTETLKGKNTGSISLDLIPTLAVSPFTLQVQTRLRDQPDSVFVNALPEIDRLATPQAVILSVDADFENIIVNWQSITNVENYCIELVEVDDPNKIIATDTAAKNETSKKFSIDSFPGKEGTYRALVQATTSDQAIMDSSKATSTNTIDRLAVPEILPFSLEIISPIAEDYGMMAHLQSSSSSVECFEYQLVIDGVPQKDTKAKVSPPEGQAHRSLSITRQTPGTYFNVQARSLATGTIPSEWISGAKGISRLALPEIESLTFDESTQSFRARLAAPVPGANRYVAQLYVNNAPVDARIEPDPDTLYTQPSFVIPVNLRLQGEVFNVQVRAFGEECFPSFWGESKTPLTKLNNPQFQPLTLINKNMLGGFLQGELPHADHYLFRLIANDDYASDAVEVIPTAGVTTGIYFTLPIEIDPLIIGYAIEVIAFAKGYVPSRPVWSNMMNRLDAPEGIKVVIDEAGNRITASWSPVSGNAGYMLRLLERPDIQVRTDIDAVQGSISIANIPIGVKGPFTVQVKTLGKDKLDSVYRDGEPGALYIKNDIHITEAPIWLPERYRLPLEINLDFTCRGEMDLLALCYSETKEFRNPTVLQGNFLTWLVAPKRSGIRFISQPFIDDRYFQTPTPWAKLELGRKYRLRCVIKPYITTYYLNGVIYGVMNCPPGFMPSEGHIGFLIYSESDILVENVQVVIGGNIPD